MKKICAFVVAFLMAITVLSPVVFAAEPEIGIIGPVGEPSKYGYQEYGFFDNEGNPIEVAERQESIELFGSSLPEKYDSRDYGYISPVRDQGAFGTCWAHAFAACAEANMIKKGYEEQFNNYSELHLAYFYHRRNEAQGDGVDKFDPDYGYFGGGNGIYAARFAENFQALAVESDFPYSMISASSDFYIDEEYRNHADVRMVDYGEIYTASDAKKAIMRYGAISLGYASLEEYFPVSENFGYYQNASTDTNHEVTVVGWDDNFSVTNFDESCRPSNPGAWLIKNSWGKDYGDMGYFWLSYEDPSINFGCYYNFEPIGDESKVHTYNGGLANIWWKIQKAANVFEAKEDQTVHSVGFDSATVDVVPEKYTIEIYVSDSKPSAPDEGTKVTTLSGAIDHDGFVHVDLTEPIELTKGQYLSVIVAQTDNSGNYAATFFEADEDFTSHEGESFFCQNGRWYDSHNCHVGVYTLKNNTIKAYYKTDVATVTFNTRQAQHFETQSVNDGECIIQPEDPVMEGYEFLGWYSNNTVTEPWDFSTPIYHDMVLFAKWEAPENVAVKNKSEYFSETYKPTHVLVGENIKEFRFYFFHNGKYYSRSGVLESEHTNKWYNFGTRPMGSFQVFADVIGINGEEFTLSSDVCTITDQPAISVHEGFVNIVNIPPYGADLYVAQYDENGRFIGVDKTSHYRSNSANGVDIITHKVIKASGALQNPRYFLWNAGEITPLCAADEPQ